MIGIFIITLVALLLGTLLVLVDNKINKKNPKEDEYLKRLPGYNCGACGYGSCAGMAHEMLKSIEVYKKCRPLRGDKLKELESYINDN